MLTRSEAISRAKDHVAANVPPHPEYRFVVPEPLETPDGWFFWHSFEHVGDLPPDQWEQFLGAAGFVVSKRTGRVEVVALVPNGVMPPKRPWWRFWRAR